MGYQWRGLAFEHGDPDFQNKFVTWTNGGLVSKDGGPNAAILTP